MRRLFTCVGIVVAISAVSAQLAGGIRSPQQAAALSQPPKPSPVTAPVERRVLRERVALQGKVKAPAEKAIGVGASLGSDTLVVTATPLRRGMRVHDGQVAVEVSGRPLILLEGTVPMYRDLRVGDRGHDVQQLQAALARLGMGPGLATGVLTAQTAAAMQRLYRSRGYDPASAVDGAATRTADAAEAGPLTAADGEEDEPGARAGAPRTSTLVAPRSEVAFVRTLPGRLARVRQVGAEPGDRTVALALGVPLVRADAPETARDTLRQGRAVTIRVGGRAVRGRIDRVTRAAASPETGVASLRVVIRPRRALGEDMVGQEATVDVITGRAGGPRSRWLVVPLAAVFARADGSSAVVRLRADGARERVPVVAGRSLDGYVAVRPVTGTLEEGERVVVGE